MLFGCRQRLGFLLFGMAFDLIACYSIRSLKFRSIATSLKKSNKLMAKQFILADYISESIIRTPQISKFGMGSALLVDPSCISLNEAFLSNYSESNSYTILVDISVRSLDDISPTMENFPFWKKFVKKLNASKQSLALDKFLYIHDVGDEGVMNVALARIPLFNYQKLELARKISDSLLPTSDAKHLLVMMLSSYGDILVDPFIGSALTSAVQVGVISIQLLLIDIDDILIK